MSESLVELRNFSHTYLMGTPQSSLGIRDVSLKIDPGERIAIVGAARSGKTTLALALGALVKLRRGQVFFRGQDVSAPGFDHTQLRRSVGIAFQDPEAQLIEDIVGKDVAFGPTAIGLPAAESRLRVEESLNAVGLHYEDFRLRYVHALSGGERRRAALAGVLAMRPELLVLDEPMAGVDARGRDLLLGLLDRLSEDRGSSLVLLDTGVTDAVLRCDRLVAVEAGSVALDIPMDRVLQHANLLVEIGVALPEVTELALHLRGLFPDLPLTLDEVELASQLCDRLAS